MPVADVLTSPLSLPLTLLLVAPVAEEVVFRAGLQEYLLRQGWPAARTVGASTVVFALAHGLTRSWTLALAVIAPSLCLGWLYARYRSVLACIGLHAGFNALWLAAGAGLLSIIGFAA